LAHYCSSTLQLVDIILHHGRGNMEAAYESIHRRSSSVGKNRRKKVTFGHIEVYEHAIEMGDNSFVSDGAPITIGWELQNKRAFDISYFETYFPSEERRKDQSLKLSVAQRAKMYVRKQNQS
jgi:hypothetical protein